MDAGAGMHIPGVLFAALGGYHAIGLEIDDTRCALAAKFLSEVVDCFPKAKIAFYNRDLTEPGNWAKVAVFLFWDRVGVTPRLPSLSRIPDSFDILNCPFYLLRIRYSPTKQRRDSMKMFINL